MCIAHRCIGQKQLLLLLDPARKLGRPHLLQQIASTLREVAGIDRASEPAPACDELLFELHRPDDCR